MIHELFPSLTETASGSHPCCLVSVTYDRAQCFHGGNTGSNPVGDANFINHLQIPSRIFGDRLHSIDFELLHYSAGVSFRVTGGREHYSYRNRTRRICCFISKNLFFFLTSNKLLNNCLKGPTAPRSTFRYFWGIHRNIAMAALNRRPLQRGGSVDPREIFLSDEL